MNMKDVTLEHFNAKLDEIANRSMLNFKTWVDETKREASEAVQALSGFQPGIGGFDLLKFFASPNAECLLRTVPKAVSFSVGHRELRLNIDGHVTINMGELDSNVVFKNGARVLVIVLPNEEEKKP